jgi:hypothetical protein
VPPLTNKKTRKDKEDKSKEYESEVCVMKQRATQNVTGKDGLKIEQIRKQKSLR